MKKQENQLVFKTLMFLPKKMSTTGIAPIYEEMLSTGKLPALSIFIY